MCRVEFLLSLLASLCAVRAIPLHPRDISNPLDPLKSVASELLGFTTALSGIESAKQTQTNPSASSTPSGRSSAASGQASTAQSNLVSSDAPLSTTNKGTGSITVSATGSQLSTGGVSPTTPSSNSALLSATTTAPTSLLATSPSSTGDPIGVVPTTTESIGSSRTSTSSGPGSSSGSGSGGGSGSDSTSANSAGGTDLSPGEIAAAVILPVLALAAILFLLFRFCKPIRERYSAWRQERLERSAYRRALDDPVLAFGMRQQNGRGLDGLGMGEVEQLVRPLSFGFRNPQRQFPSIRRKPLDWDAARIGGQGASSIGMAIPMPVGQHARNLSEISEASDSSGDAEARYQDARSNQVSPEGMVS
ncbi:uncharacterized protein Z519_04289 [Cladophialophora bantiana CBS 173.52]|uniref:Uncharacterized protein n=1 Tax=Cladophialophora bantiana (strain ATCC 10958 / CBS 173.52 / CDC B-1940 / NIH 8579) TaxID=1442370 RepID=A0A0D2IG17_CLAB1|nr:uncharacterized protein Z519_04289 [Cladophialophora bantiana CBS 173.52]KIW95704.1 hypothetical protein Z519_04289 [Cladophialophora bantiana CBS 173.52]